MVAIPGPERVSSSRAGVTALGSSADAGTHATTSTTRCVAAELYRQVVPLGESAASAMLATVAPAVKFTFEASGRVSPQGNTVTKPAACGCVTVTFRKAARAPGPTPPRPATSSAVN